MNTEQNKSRYKYNQGDRVYFNMGVGQNIEGWGKIIGCSTEIMPELGRGWIIELEEESRKIDSKIYPFSSIVIFDCMIVEPITTSITENI